ncbi:putative NADP-dependent mannitol dehydrogenase [Cercospora beticola]|uniref:Putative NADP-dependent mannitol dehydrogenase n=1 Tax=Cercospora beticola TaxID=122368 RepID=A0A2G5IAB5_CERBT|nr:putative NADP-dependent mannitol dehydrogenase [Cercospora beticola]PIB01709.1 putative NADP-dependent mannitol dehydrogenase [Cercospora beticola]
MTDRDALTSRTLPFMTLSDGSESSLAGPPPPLPHYLNAEGRALARFAVEGNLITDSLLVTGGAGTLGLSAARALLEHGASGCCLWDLESTLRSSQQAISTLANDFPKQRVFGIAVDVTDEEAIAEAAATVVQNLGSIDHVFCFAGIVGCYHATEMTPDQWRKTIDINTTGSFLVAQAAARQMKAQKSGGSITLTASISAHRVNFPQPQVSYNVSKAAVVAMVKSLAAEWAVDGIRVNSISPGYMDTILNAGGGNIAEARATWASRNPMGRMGAVGELDGMCVLLASRAGTYINGSDHIIDGAYNLFDSTCPVTHS